MIESNRKPHRVRTQDSLTTQHLKEAVEQEALTLTTGHLQEMLAAKSLTTTHLKQSLHGAEGNGIQIKPRTSPDGKGTTHTTKTESK